MSSRGVRRAGVLVAVMVVGCAHGPASAPAPDAKAPARASSARPFAEMLKQELEQPLRKWSFTTPSGVKGEVEGVAAPEIEKDENGEWVNIALGTEEPVRCQVQPDRMDAAGTVFGVATSIREKFELLQVRLLEGAEVAGSPMLLAEMMYAVESPQGKTVGQLEIAILADHAHSLYCFHDEPGYSRTFARVAKALAASLQGTGEDDRTSARHREIQVARIGDLTVGVQEKVIWDRQGGGRVVEAYTAMLLPRSRNEFVAMDSFSSEASDASGMLVGQREVHAQNGEIDHVMDLEAQEGGRTFAYEGTKDGKPLKGTFQSEKGIAAEAWFSRQYDAKHDYGPAGEVRHFTYSARANPTAPVEMVVRKDTSRPKGVKASLGPLTITADLDEHGMFARSEMPMGPATLVSERVWSWGTP